MDTLSNRKTAYAYMETLFPYETVFKLLCASVDVKEHRSRVLQRRTAMTAPGRQNDWVEALGATSPEHLRKVTCGERETPSGVLARGTAIHVGPVVTPRLTLIEEPSAFEEHRGSRPSTEVWRDFVIDIDLDDYDDGTINEAVRFCACAGKKKSCPVCWRYIQASHAFLKHRLKDRFGVDPESLLWVKSGNKGAHCWIGIQRFARMSKELRPVVMSQLTQLPETLDRPRDTADFRVLVDTALTPFLDTTLKDIRFHRVLRDVLSKKFGMLAGDVPGSVSSASDLYTWMRRLSGTSWANDVKLHMLRVFIAPRYDKGVLSTSIHLAKVPFSVNSSTLRVSIPIVDIRNVRKPPLASQVTTHPSLIQAELALFERWTMRYLEPE